MTLSTRETSPAIRHASNPFAVESPEKLTAEQLVQLFVSDYTDINTVKQRKHTFIWGSRGSGKSMMLRYLEPRCQAIVHKGLGKTLEGNEPFLGIYCPCKEGQINKTDFDVLGESAQLVLSEHLINLTIASRLVVCLDEQVPIELVGEAERKTFSAELPRLFDAAAIAGSASAADRGYERDAHPLKWLKELLRSELRKIFDYLRAVGMSGPSAVYTGATSGYHDFLLPMMELTKGMPAFREAAIYVLIDDADRLKQYQQRIINSWIANRDQSTLCVKVTSRRDEYGSLLTIGGSLIEQPHDYSQVDAEDLYTRSRSDYGKKAALIATRRLELSPVSEKQPERFFPANELQQQRLEELELESAEEWKRVGEPGRKRDFVYRYASARLFQELKRTKQRRSYAGFQSLVDLSSGVIRDLLEPCYLMVDACLKGGGKQLHELASIPSDVQDRVCLRYSEEFIEKFDTLRKELPPERWSTLEGLRTLVESLGRLFYERLHDPQAKEVRLFSITLTGPVPRDLQDVLDMGVRFRYFQRRTYSTKDGGGREPWYILNRRLCPLYKLDPAGFEGRVTISPELLRLACTDPARFVRTRLGRVDHFGATPVREQETLPFDEGPDE